MLTDKKIGVLMGGTSAEREVSLKSGSAVFNALKNLGYNVVAIEIVTNKVTVPVDSVSEQTQTLKTDTESDSSLVTCHSSQICEVIRKEGIDIAFIALHGGHGEDGSIQGLLEVMGIPYTGSGVLASALAMDKEASKKIFLYHKIPVPPFVIVTSDKQNTEDSPPTNPSPSMGEGLVGVEVWALGSELIDFEMPWVIKPAKEGSSVGVSIVKDEGQLEAAIEKASSFGGKVIIEKYIEGKEVQIGILGERVLGGVEVRPSLEFYSYEAKYTAGLTEYILPPEIDEKIYERAKEIALSAHMALGCRGATRVDLIIDKDGNPYVLEVNTIPGMTEVSLLPKIAREAGLDFPELIEGILKLVTSNDL